MAARKLAPPELQPDSFAFTPENLAWADTIIAKYPPGRQASAVIALLGKAQEQFGGWLPQKAMEAVAEKLSMPYMRVMEVATFYSMFNLDPVGKHFIQLCGTTPCGLRGAGALKEVLKRRVGAERHISGDGQFSWLEVECLGACCNAPMVQINDDYYEDLTPEIFERVLDDLAAGRPVKPGSQAGRSTSEPLGAKTSLTDETLFDGSRLGAWRKRFEEEAANKAAEQRAEAEAASTDKRAAEDPRPAKPDAGRPIERGVIDTPAHRNADGRPVQDPKAQAEQSSTDRSTVVKPREDEKPNLAPQSSKSYVGVPSDPDKGHPVPEPETSPVSGTPESVSNVRRDGSESKPDVVVDDKTS